ncbi:MAG: glutathione S-transferase [Gammaproteobacteria bacterium]|nr:glutathione S-transferase [Gammaproteobacteria bacterium]
MAKFKISYFDIDGGRAEPIRLALSLGGIEFEDHRLSFAEFKEMRAGTPLNALPVFEIDGVAYTQSNAMCRYVGKLTGLYPSDPWQAFLCDEVMDIVEDAVLAFGRTMRLEGDELKSARKDLVDGMYTRCLQLLDKRLEAAGGQYFAGGHLTVADLKAYVWLKRLRSGEQDHVPVDLADRLAPALVRHMERVAAEPGVAAYYARRAK